MIKVKNQLVINHERGTEKRLGARRVLGPLLGLDFVNSEVSEGYLPKHNTPEELYVGEAAVTTQNGKCHVLTINTTEKEIEFCVPPQEVDIRASSRIP